MKISRLEQAMDSLLGDRNLTPALDTLRGSSQLGGSELDEFVAAAETLAKRIRDRGKKAAKSEAMVRPWV